MEELNEQKAISIIEREKAFGEYLEQHQDNIFRSRRPETYGYLFFKDKSIVPQWVLECAEEENRSVDAAKRISEQMRIAKMNRKMKR